MARKKVNLQWITNKSTRRATYKKRRDGLMKKTDELTKLCGIKACVVVYGEGEGGNKPQSETWPSDEGEAKKFLMNFKEMPELGSFKKMQNQETLLESRCSKLREQERKLFHGNHEDETLIHLHSNLDGSLSGFSGMTEDEAIRLRKKVEMKMCKTKTLLHHLLEQESLSVSPLVLPPTSSSSQMQVSSNNNEMQIEDGAIRGIPTPKTQLTAHQPGRE